VLLPSPAANEIVGHQSYHRCPGRSWPIPRRWVLPRCGRYPHPGWRPHADV